MPAEGGRGAMGTVYKARDPVLDRVVAIKMMSEDLLIEEEMRGRFDREARSAARLQHPNIVTIFDFGELEGEGVPFIVMELLEGDSLAELMERAEPERLETGTAGDDTDARSDHAAGRRFMVRTL